MNQLFETKGTTPQCCTIKMFFHSLKEQQTVTRVIFLSCDHSSNKIQWFVIFFWTAFLSHCLCIIQRLSRYFILIFKTAVEDEWINSFANIFLFFHNFDHLLCILIFKTPVEDEWIKHWCNNSLMLKTICQHLVTRASVMERSRLYHEFALWGRHLVSTVHVTEGAYNYL